MTDLTDRMRTCAARIVAVASGDDVVYNDAADLLIEASNVLEESGVGTVVVDRQTAEALGLPMEIIPPPPPPGFAIDRAPTAMWTGGGDTLPKANPYRSAGTCPQCDSRAGKTVRREGAALMLICPACGHRWRYRR